MVKRDERSMADALELPGDEGRDKLRKAAGRSKYPVIRGLPNGVTRALQTSARWGLKKISLQGHTG